MINQLKEWEEELANFNECQREATEEKAMLYINLPGQEKAHPMKELAKELFTLEDQDNKNTPPILKELSSCYDIKTMDCKNG